MGVHGLWELLSPVGVRVSNDLVRGKVLAIDVSIWLTQFVIAMRDAEGAQIRNAHLLGVFRRCIKLLFLSVRPVLVFDGATPALKRRTLAKRRAQRERHAAKLRKLAEKLLLNQMKSRVIGNVIEKRNTAQRIQSDPTYTENKDPNDTDHAVAPSDEDRIEPAPPRSTNHPKRGDTPRRVTWADQQPPPNNARTHGSEDEDKIEPVNKEAAVPMKPNSLDSAEAGNEPGFFADDLADDEEALSRDREAEPIALPQNLDEIDDDTLIGLPHNMQSEVFKQIKLQQRARHRERMMLKQSNPSEFSKTQIEGFLQSTALNRKISSVRSAINSKSGASQRIASDSGRQYILKEKAGKSTDAGDVSDDEFDDDGDDDMFPGPSSSEKYQDRTGGAQDILARLQADRDAKLKRSENKAEHKKIQQRQEREKESGVGWASRVLEGRGGLRLGGESALGVTHARSPESPDGGENSASDGLSINHDKLEHLSESGDEDDMEWEDGNASVNNNVTQAENAAQPHQEGLALDIEKDRPMSDGHCKPTPGREVPLQATSMRASGPSPKFNFSLDMCTETVQDLPNTCRSSLEKGPNERLDQLERPIHSAEVLAAVTGRGISEKFSSRAEKGFKDEVKSILKSNREIQGTALQGGEPTKKTHKGSLPLQKGSASDAIASHLKREEAVEARSLCGTDFGSSNHRESKVLEPSSSSQASEPLQKTTHQHSSEEPTGTKSKATFEEERDMQMAIARSLENAERITVSQNVPREAEEKRSNDVTSRSSEIGQRDGLLEIPEAEKEPTGREMGLSTTPTRMQKDVTSTEQSVRTGADETDTENDNSRASDLLHASEEEVNESQESVAEIEAAAVSDSRHCEAEDMSTKRMEELRNELEAEADQIRKERASHQGASESLADDIYAETRDLLKLFGIPYLEAPTEAEAQCAFLDKENVVDGVITEDSDAFLFGARKVYRHLFSEGRFAESYEMADMQKNLGLDRELLIKLAYLLGSDYTSGVRGVGIVNSMEILEAFPGESGLHEFRKWTESVTVLDREPGKDVMLGHSQDAIRRRFCWKHRNMKRNWDIREGFPNPAVAAAYRSPDVDQNTEKFKWGRIDFSGLGRFCWEKFGWEKDTFETAVGPLRKKLSQQQAGPHQMRIDEFFKPHRFAKIRSERLQKAVRGMAGDEAAELMAEYGTQVGKRRKALPVSHMAPQFSDDEAEMVAAAERAEKDNDAKRQRKAEQKRRKYVTSNDSEYLPDGDG